jgi:hypothetical protein
VFVFLVLCPYQVCKPIAEGRSASGDDASDYGDPAFDGLLEYLRPRVQDQCGLRLLPTYSYFRMYKHGDVLRRHRDRPACEISVTLNIG